MILTDWEGVWMEKWFVAMKKADFNGIAEKYQISPIIARLMRNRDVIGDEAIDFYLNGTVEDLYDGLLMKDIFFIRSSRNYLCRQSFCMSQT